MSTPLYDGLLSEVLAGAHVHRDRLATARAGIDRLHGPDDQDRCSTCRVAWPCTTRRLVDGLARGDLDTPAAGALVDAELGADVTGAAAAPAARTQGGADAASGTATATGTATGSGTATEPGSGTATKSGAMPGAPAEPEPASQATADTVSGGGPERPAGLEASSAGGERPRTEEAGPPQAPARQAQADATPYPSEPTAGAPTAPAPTPPRDPEAPVRPLPRMPGFAELLEGSRTGRALDVLLGRRHSS